MYWLIFSGLILLLICTVFLWYRSNKKYIKDKQAYENSLSEEDREFLSFVKDVQAEIRKFEKSLRI